MRRNISIGSCNVNDLTTGICGYCHQECDEEARESGFEDGFGYVSDCEVVSSCCGSNVYKGKIFTNTSSVHIARKDHKDGTIKKGDKYRSSFIKGYYIDDNDNHHGILEYTKRLCP